MANAIGSKLMQTGNQRGCSFLPAESLWLALVS